VSRTKVDPAIFAYVVVDSEREIHDPTLPLEHAPQPPAVGHVAVFQQRGPRVITEETDHGPATDRVTFVHVADGRLVDGEPAFDGPEYRLLALLQIGAQQERVLHEQIDRVFERFEEYLDKAHAVEPNEQMLERLRREFP
jgi:hypothetical protein